MASEPSRAWEVGKRTSMTSSARIRVMVVLHRPGADEWKWGTTQGDEGGIRPPGTVASGELVGVLGGDDLGSGVDDLLDVLAVDGVEGRLRPELAHLGGELGDRGEL